MKRLLLLCLIQLLCFTASYAQFFPETGAVKVCSNCVPSQSYSIVSGSPYVSDVNYYGASQLVWKNSSNNTIVLPVPPSSNVQSAINYSSKTFLTLISGPNIDSKVKFTVGGFIPGQKYNMHYAVMASRLLSSTFGSEAVLEVQAPNNPANIASATVDLTPAKNLWLQKEIEFTPTTEDVVFLLSGNTTVGTGLVNFDISAKPLDCILPVNKQVTLYKPHLEVMYPCQTSNLDLLVKLPLPTGAEVVWKHSFDINSPSMTKQQAQNAPVDPSGYSAFYYHNANSCYSLESGVSSTSVVDIIYTPVQVPLNLGAVVAVACPNTEYFLNTKLATQSDVSRVRWFDNNKHQGNPIPAQKATMSGKYYAFFYSNEFNCYSTDISTSSITVTFETPCCLAGNSQVTLQSATAVNACPSSTVDLNTLVTSSIPANTNLVWFDNPNHTGTAIATPGAVGDGTYYAFIFDPQSNCYNTDASSAEVTVAINPCIGCGAGTDPVGLTSAILNNVCPASTANLNSVFDGTLPGRDVVVQWFTNANHTGKPVAQPGTVPADTYYAFFYDSKNGCYNTDNSTAIVNVTIKLCPAGVQLGMKVALQGAMPAMGSTMRNDLQTYSGTGLLPMTDVYGSGAFYADINNVLGIGGTVVDWIKVEIRSASTPATVLQSKSLLLKTNGSVVDVNGLVPVFASQSQPVKIVVKHRNHIAIMSKTLALFNSGTINYDFTTSLEEASNDGSAPNQMVLVNGLWCMISGDVNQNLAVSSQDVNQTRNAYNEGLFDVYSNRDLNMNGVVQNTDMNVQRNRFNTGYFSILVNY
jgi:hypothetical protein